MNFFDWFKPKPYSSPFLGANIDDRPQSEKDEDIKFSDVVATADAVIWEKKRQSQLRKFPDIFQKQAGSCVAATMSKLLGIKFFLKFGEYIQFCWGHIYQRRSNKPKPGMIGANAFEIAEQGTTLNVLSPTPGTDEAIDSMVIEDYKKAVGEIFKSGKGVIATPGDFEAIASIIQKTEKGVMVWFYFNADEWSRLVPVILDPNLQKDAPGTLRHSVTAVDYFIVSDVTQHNGKKALYIEDSAPFGGITRRIITEEFFKARNFFAGYIQTFKFEEGGPVRPKYVGTIISLQECLRFEGFFPMNVSYIENVGPVTREAIKKFQTKYGLAVTSSITDQLRAKLTELYG